MVCNGWVALTGSWAGIMDMDACIPDLYVDVWEVPGMSVFSLSLSLSPREI